MLRRPFPTNGGERGAVLVLTALLLVAMMGFAAIAVDAAGAWSEKREVQSSADMGSLAAVQAIPRTLLADALANSAAEGADFVTRNADAAPSVGAPTAGPSCDLRPPGFIRQCLTNVAVDAAGSSDNAFAPAIGAGASVDIPASAEAQIDIEYPAMKLFPIGVDSVGGQRLRCTAQGGPLPGPPPIPQCAVHFGSYPFPDPLPDPLLPVALGNPDLRFLGLRRADQGCVDLIVETTNANLALGVDHLVDDDMSAPPITSQEACADGHELTLPTSFQNIPPLQGILTGGVAPLLSGSEELWDFLTPASSGLCHPLLFTTIVHPDPAVVFTLKTVLLNTCLQGAIGSNPVFSFPTGGHRRLGWAIDQSSLRVQGFVPVWIHSLVDGFMTPQSTSPRGFSVFVLDPSWLPSNLTEVDPGGMDNLTFKLVD